MRVLLDILVVFSLGCGAETASYCQPPPRRAPDNSCPAANEGKGHCTADRTGIWYCGGGHWSLIHCPQGVSCVEAGDGVGCM